MGATMGKRTERVKGRDGSNLASAASPRKVPLTPSAAIRKAGGVAFRS